MLHKDIPKRENFRKGKGEKMHKVLIDSILRKMGMTTKEAIEWARKEILRIEYLQEKAENWIKYCNSPK